MQHDRKLKMKKILKLFDINKNWAEIKIYIGHIFKSFINVLSWETIYNSIGLIKGR